LPILFAIYIRDICKTTLDTFTFLNINNINIGSYAKLIWKLKQILKKTTKVILQEAIDSAIEFDVEKT
jgi:hypothetical protein